MLWRGPELGESGGILRIAIWIQPYQRSCRCGIVALSMAAAALTPEKDQEFFATSRTGQIQQRAIERGFSRQGELFRVVYMRALCQEFILSAANEGNFVNM